MQPRQDNAQRRRIWATGLTLAFLAVAVYAVVLMKFFVAQ